MTVYELITELQKAHNQEAEILFRTSMTIDNDRRTEKIEVSSVDKVKTGMKNFVIIEGSCSL